jgi:YVTN family beta-propeller protein
VAVHPSGELLYASVQAPPAPPGAEPEFVVVIDAATNQVVDRIQFNGPPVGVLVHPNGAVLYVTLDQGAVAIVDTTLNRVLRKIRIGREPNTLKLHPLGHLLYVSNNGENTVTMIDTASSQALGKLVVGEEPAGIEVHPTGTHLYVLNRGSRDISVIETGGHTIVETIPVDLNPSSWGDFLVGATDVGGSIGGFRIDSLECVNHGSGQIVELLLDRADFSWNCDASGFAAEPGDDIEFEIIGRKRGTVGNLHGVVSGIALASVECSNLTTGAQTTLDVASDQSWDCESDETFEVAPRDRVRVRVLGTSGDS